MNTSMSGHVQAVREGDGRARPQIGGEVVAIEVALQLVGGEHHRHVGPFRGLCGGHDLEAGSLGLRPGPAGPQADDDILHAAVAHVLRMGMALAAEADDRDLLGLDQVHIRIAVVVDAHLSRSPWLDQVWVRD
jgi:hypothetical protein